MPQPETLPTPTTLRGDDVDIPPSLLTGGGVISLLVLLFWMLATDRLVTGAAHRRELADKDSQRDVLLKTIDVKDSQLEKLAVVGETTVRILSSVEALAKERNE